MAKPPPSEAMGGPELPPHFKSMSLLLLCIAIGSLLVLSLSRGAL